MIQGALVDRSSPLSLQFSATFQAANRGTGLVTVLPTSSAPVTSSAFWARTSGGGCFLAPPQVTSTAGSLRITQLAELLGVNVSSALRRGGSRCLRAQVCSVLAVTSSWFLGVHSQAPERP